VRTRRPQEIFVFIMGGTTYEEALAVHQLAGETNARILLGASTVHNSQRYTPSLTPSTIAARLF
jgi:vacuolar protein sorting-associated protein 45